MEPMSGCWLWTRSMVRDRNGRRYPRFQRLPATPGKFLLLRSMFLPHGPAHEVVTTCGVPECVAPSHLRLVPARMRALAAMARLRHAQEQTSDKTTA